MQMDILQLQLLEQENQFSIFFNNKSTTPKKLEKNQSINMCSKSERWESKCMIYEMIYLLTAIGLPPGGSSTYSTHLHTNNTQNNMKKHNTENRTYIIIGICKHNNKNT